MHKLIENYWPYVNSELVVIHFVQEAQLSQRPRDAACQLNISISHSRSFEVTLLCIG